MKIRANMLKRIIKEELENILDEERPEDVEPREGVWAGCDDAGNLELSIDHSKAGGSEPVTDHPETLAITEFHGASHGPPDTNNDGMLTPEELFYHFDLDSDGTVTAQDYADHVGWHCKNPEILDDYEVVKESGLEASPCPHSYEAAADSLVMDASKAHDLIRPVMDATGVGCPASAARALSDILGIAQEAGIVTPDE